MTAQTVSANKNLDDSSISALANAETITIDTGARLTINSDTRWGQQAVTLGNISINSTTGGQVYIDGTTVWWVPYSSATGNVPSLGTVGTADVTRGGSNVGEFLGIWTALAVAPSTAGGAMPSTGYIKLRTKTATFAASDVLTFTGGATATLSSAGKRGWLNIAGVTGLSVTVPRRGRFETTGDWFEIGTTNGSTDQLMQLPVLQLIGAVWVETAASSGVYEKWCCAGGRWRTIAGSTISSITRSGTTATMTVATNPNLGVGSVIRVSGCTQPEYNGEFNVVTASTTTITYVMSADPGSSATGSPVYVTDLIPTDSRGKYFGQELVIVGTTASSNPTITSISDTSSIEIGAAVSGTSIPTGAYVISKTVSSITLSQNCTGANSNLAFFVATSYVTFAQRTGLRAGYLPATGLRVRIPNLIFTTSRNNASDYGSNGAYASSQYRVNANSGGVVVVSNVCGALDPGATNAYTWSISYSAFIIGLSPNTIPTSLTLNDVAVSFIQQVDQTAFGPVSCTAGGTVTNCRFERLRSDLYTVLYTGCANFTIINQYSVVHPSATGVINTNNGGLNASYLRCSDFTITGSTVIANALALQQCARFTISSTVYACQLHGAVSSFGNQNGPMSIDVTSRDITIDGFSFFPTTGSHCYGAIFSVSNDCSNIEIKNVGTASSPINCGSDATYYPANLLSAVACNNVTLRRCYVSGLRSSLISDGNTARNISLINCWGTGTQADNIKAVNVTAKGNFCTAPTVAQTAQYGRHWEDGFPTTTTGYIQASFNEPSADTTSQVTVTAGTPAFTAANTLAMPTVGDQVILEMLYFALGHTSTANAGPTLTGTNTANLTLEFQYDLGSGYNGSWVSLTQVNWFAVGSITASVGIRVKIRITTNTASSTNAIGYLRLDTVTDSTSQKTQYPLPGVSYTLTGLQPGSEVRAYLGTDPATATQIDGVESSGTSFSFTHTSAGSTGYIVIFALGYIAIQLSVTYSSSAVTTIVQQSIDRQYSSV